MKVRKCVIRRLGTILMAGAMLVSATSCGDKEVVVEDYGGLSHTEMAASGTNAASSGDAEADIESGVAESVKEMLGGNVKWTDKFVVQNKNVSPNVHYQVPDIDGMNIYSIKYMSNEDSREEWLVKSLFPGGAEKVEEIGFTNGTDYMPHLYKLRKMQRMIDIVDGKIIISNASTQDEEK